jgi:hypothetical protein
MEDTPMELGLLWPDHCPVWPCRFLIVAAAVVLIFGVVLVRKMISKPGPPN